MRLGALSVAIALLAVVGLAGTIASALGCDENLQPGSTREELRTRAGLDDLGTFASAVYLLAPLLTFIGLVAVAPAARRHPLVSAAAIAAMSVIGYSIFVARVT